MGCAATGSESGGDRRAPSATPGPTGAASAGAGAQAGAGADAFGNTTATAPMLAPLAPGAGDCVVGQFCKPKEPDPDNCGSLTLEGDVEVIEHPGNVLLVFDTSGSMAQDWNGATRWEQAGPAIAKALMPLADKLTIGTVFFPRSDPNAPATCIDPTGITCIFLPGLVAQGGTCGVTPITDPNQINFQPGPAFLTAFSAGMPPAYAPVPGGRTPLKEGLQQAQAALAGATLTGITSVVIVTDGDPNCEWDANVSTQIVTDWAAMGIKTYVVGLPGTSGAGDAVLQNLAVAGGTGMYITPDNAAELETKLGEIATETVQAGFKTCTINLDPVAAVPDDLHLVATEGGMEKDVPHSFSTGEEAWTITSDGATVELLGNTCAAAMNATYESIRFVFGCVELPPALPPPPVE